MSTEARIGVVAGLFIVVVTSVYFFYGQSSKMDDLLVTSTGAKVSPPPKIPAAGEAAKPAAPVSTPPTALANQKPSTPQPNGAAASPFILDRSPSTVDADRLANADPSSRLNAPLSAPPGASTPTATDNGPTIGVARGAPPRIGGDPARGAGTTGDDLAPTTWDRLSKSTEKPAERVALDDKPASASEDMPSLAVGGADHRNDSKLSPASGESPAKPREPTGSLAVDSRRQLNAPPVESKPASAAATWPKQHKIVSGDTLIGLAFAYYEDTSRVSAILAANPQIKNPRGLKIGQVVTIPAPGAESSRATQTASASRNESSGLVTLTGRTAQLRDASASDLTVKPAAARTYTVQDGDTFFSIAARLYGDGNKWRALYEANKAIVKNDPKRLRTGMNLTVPASSSQRP